MHIGGDPTQLASEFFALNGCIDDDMQSDGGLKKKILVEGAGQETPESGDDVTGAACDFVNIHMPHASKKQGMHSVCSCLV